MIIIFLFQNHQPRWVAFKGQSNDKTQALQKTPNALPRSARPSTESTNSEKSANILGHFRWIFFFGKSKVSPRDPRSRAQILKSQGTVTFWSKYTRAFTFWKCKVVALRVALREILDWEQKFSKMGFFGLYLMLFYAKVWTVREILDRGQKFSKIKKGLCMGFLEWMYWGTYC